MDGIFDCAWSEENELILISACGDGTLKVWWFGYLYWIDIFFKLFIDFFQLWDTSMPNGRPIQSIQAHEKEIYSVNWNGIAKGLYSSFLS